MVYTAWNRKAQGEALPKPKSSHHTLLKRPDRAR